MSYLVKPVVAVVFELDDTLAPDSTSQLSSHELLLLFYNCLSPRSLR